MNSDTAVILVVALLCAAWAASILYTRRPSRHYWLDPEPPLHQRRCPLCERAIFYAKTTEGHTLTLDASVPIYVQVQHETGTIRVCQVAAYIEHAALCYAIPHLPSTAVGRGIRNGRAHHAPEEGTRDE